jgi:transposase-like protein
MTGWSLTIAMKKSKFTESQIVFALQQAESGVTVAEVCRKLGISEATFYSWKKKYSGLRPGRAAPLAAAGRRERAVETDRGGPDAGQTDAAGRVKKKL